MLRVAVFARIASLRRASGNVFVPQALEQFTYDVDGNLLTDGRWTYAWDGENRLVSLTANTNVPTAARLKIELGYDVQGRRTSKKVSAWNGSSYVAQSTNRFVYDGWNLLGELDVPSGTLVRSYVWGTDLSGTTQGAGGVGGLLMSVVHTGTEAGTYFAAYDGNGNVVGLIRSSDGLARAEYEYGPFGEVIRASGPIAKTNPFRFSTKFQDDKSDLLYYGYRFYNPSTGRWLSRDPIGEKGGLNMYDAFRNNSLRYVDRNGLDNWSDPGAGQNSPPRLSPPYHPGPGPWDGPNVFGIGGRKGVEDYADWFEQRFPNSIAGAKNLLITRMISKACAQMGKYPTTLPDLNDGKDDVDFNADKPRSDMPSDKPQTWYERNIRIGSFQVRANDVRLRWKSGCCFSYSATVYVEEHTGADAPWDSDYHSFGEDILYPTGMFVARDVRMAEWRISGEHCCFFKLLSSPK